MSKDNILPFGNKKLASVSCADSHKQLNLFEDDVSLKKITFLDVRIFAQESLLRVIARNTIRSLIDLRSRPVFDRPKFNHKIVVSYLFAHNVRYIEYALLSKEISRLRGREFVANESELQAFGNIFMAGLNVCLFDQDDRMSSWVDEIRVLTRRTVPDVLELNPRALLGLPIMER